MAEKVFTYINNGKNPIKIRNAKNEAVLVPVGGGVELDEAGVKVAKTLNGFQDLSKIARPAGESALLKENAELKAKLAAQAGDFSDEALKENADLKASIEALKKENAQLKEDLEITKL